MKPNKLFRMFSFCALACIALSGALLTSADTPDFKDIGGHWAKNYINKMAELGIVKGRSTTQFAPDDPITRAELTKIAVSSFGYEVPETVETAPFPDVPASAWFAPYVQIAKEKGIVEGVNGYFNPNDPITRVAALKIFIECAQFENVDNIFKENYQDKLLRNVDFDDVSTSQWFAKYVA